MEQLTRLSWVGLGLFTVGSTFLFFAGLVYVQKGLIDEVLIGCPIGFALVFLGLLAGLVSALRKKKE